MRTHQVPTCTDALHIMRAVALHVKFFTHAGDGIDAIEAINGSHASGAVHAAWRLFDRRRGDV